MKSNIFILLIIIFISATVFSQSQNPNLNTWITDGAVYTIASDNNFTYIGGNFSYVGPCTGSGAKFETSNTQPDKSFPKIIGSINTAVPDGKGGWFIGGDFTQVGKYVRNRLAEINSDGTVSDWNPGADKTVDKIVISGNYLYVSGAFANIGGKSRKYLAKISALDGSVDDQWNPTMNGVVNSISLNGNSIYLAGEFTKVDDQERNHLVKLNNTDGNVDKNWNPDANGNIENITVSDNYVYVCGKFSSIGRANLFATAKLNTTNGDAYTTWATYNDTQVDNIIINGSEVYISGAAMSYNSDVFFISRYTIDSDGSLSFGWTELVNGLIRCMKYDNNYLYFGGNFTEIGIPNYNNEIKKHIARFKLTNTSYKVDSLWDPCADGAVKCIAIDGSNIYLGGDFNSVGGKTRNHIAKINNLNGTLDENWDPNINSIVNSIALSGEYLYVGGSFTLVNGQNRNNLAKIDRIYGKLDNKWNPDPVSSNSFGFINSIVISDNDIYVGGRFSSIGSNLSSIGRRNRSNLAKLNNTYGVVDLYWHPNPDKPVYCLAITNNNIYAGGDFTSVGGIERDRLVKLDNISGKPDPDWNPGANGKVRTIANSSNYIYAGGAFDLINGSERNYIAKINNSDGNVDPNWNPNADGEVYGIVSNGNDIYACGVFNNIGGEKRNYLVKINGSSGNADANWNPDVNGITYSVAVNDNDIYIGGEFTTLDNNLQPHFVQFKGGTTRIENKYSYPASFSLYQNYPNPFNPETTIKFIITNAGRVKIKIFDMLGREIATLLNQYEEAGVHKIKWNAKNVSSGIYFYRLETGNSVITKKLVLLK